MMYSSGRFSPPGRSNSFQSVCGSSRSSHFNNIGSGTNPFSTPAANANTKFVPTKIGTSKSQNMTLSDFSSTPTKPPKPPEKPLTPYMRYSRKVRASNPDSKLWDIGKVVGSMWRELPDQAKQIYFDEYEMEKVEYEKAFKAYKNSPAYIAYEQQSRNKNRTEKNVRSSAVADSRVYIQPVDEDDGEDHAALMQLVGSRFERNQKLMLEIFNNTIVPDPRTVISGQRMAVLKRQVKSLTTHQRKLEDELEQLESKFQEKKRSISECSQSFSQKLKKVCEEAPTLDEGKFEEMVEKATSKLLQSYEEYKQKQKEISTQEVQQETQIKTSTNNEEIKQEIVESSTTNNEQQPIDGENSSTDEKNLTNEKIEAPPSLTEEESSTQTLPPEPPAPSSTAPNNEEPEKKPAAVEENNKDVTDESMDTGENETNSEMDDEGFTDED